MSAFLALALLGVVWGFMRQARLLAGAPPSAPAAATLALAPGAHVLSAALNAGHLSLHLKTQAGDEVDVIDVASGRLVQQTRTPAP